MHAPAFLIQKFVTECSRFFYSSLIRVSSAFAILERVVDWDRHTQTREPWRSGDDLGIRLDGAKIRNLVELKRASGQGSPEVAFLFWLRWRKKFDTNNN